MTKKDLDDYSVLDAISAGFVVVGPDHRIVGWNVWMAHATGKSQTEVTGKSLRDIFPTHQVALLENAIASALDSGASTLITNALHPRLLPLRTRAGQPLHHDVSISAIGQAPNGKCLIHVTDVTLSARRERFLRDRQNARYDALVESASDVIMTLDSEGVIRMINAATTRQFGYAVDDLVGQAPTVLFETPGIWNNTWREVSAGKVITHPVELLIHRKDGSLRYFEVSASRWLDGSRVFITAIFRDINERREAEAALRDSEAMSRSRALALASLNEALKQNSEALNAVDQRKDEFIATLAHELRNPLAPLSNALQILKLAKGNPEIVEESRSMMERQLAQMVRLIDDLLDISRINQDKIELNKERASLDRIIFQAVESSRPLIDAQQHRLTIDIPDEQIPLDADVVRLTQVLANLLNNAAKYTKPGGDINVKVDREENVAVIRVIDNGVGMPAEMLSKIFDLFMQIDNSLGSSQGGLGIGLSLVKRLTEMHDGTVSAHSMGLGTGSEFVVRLPVAVGSFSAPDIVQSSSNAISGRRILIADDNQDAADSLALILSMKGHETRTAHDGVAALKIADDFKPEFILLDIGMPKLNGYDTARQLRRRPWAQQIFVVALTGWGQARDIESSQAAGFDAHLVKPVDIDDIDRLLIKSGERFAAQRTN